MRNRWLPSRTTTVCDLDAGLKAEPGKDLWTISSGCWQETCRHGQTIQRSSAVERPYGNGRASVRVQTVTAAERAFFRAIRTTCLMPK